MSAEPFTSDAGVCPICIAPMGAEVPSGQTRGDERAALQCETEEQAFTLECGHVFHSECIMQWFRTGNQRCPMCNDPGVNAECVSGRRHVNMVLNYLRRHPKTVCGDVPSILRMYDEGARKLRMTRQSITEFEREHRGELRRYRRMKSKKDSLAIELDGIERQLLSVVRPMILTKRFRRRARVSTLELN